jgi:DhnA family fructose-bisphosphate aldolase class Ia
MDHGIDGANYAGLASPGRTLDEVIGAGADAILTTPGLADAFAARLQRVGLILTLDLASGNEEAAVREATVVGADMAKFVMMPWSADLPDSVAHARHLAVVCHDYGLPLMVEPIPVSFTRIEAHTPDKIGQAARIACELGADVIKMQYAGDTEQFQRIVGTLFRPVVILGGPERSDDRRLLQEIREAIDAGAIGVAIGRNIWNRARPGHMVAALNALIHGAASTDEAMRELRTVVAVGR